MRNPEQPCVCELRDACCMDDRCPQIVAEVKADIGRHHVRERLQILEAWKLDADETELELIGALEDFLKDTLDEERDNEFGDDEDHRLDDPRHGQAAGLNRENRGRS